MIKKCMVVFFLSLVFLIGICTSVFAEEVKVSVNDELIVSPDVPPQTIDGRTVVPLRLVSTVLGAQVGWDNDNQTAIIRKDFLTNVSINQALNPIKDGQLKLEINGEIIYPTKDAPLLMIENRVVVPLRFLAQRLGAYITWDGGNNTVIIIPEVKRTAITLLSSSANNLQNELTPTIKVDFEVALKSSADSKEVTVFREKTLGMLDRRSKETYFSINSLSGNQEYNAELYLSGTKGYIRYLGESWEEVALTDEGISILNQNYDVNNIFNYVKNEGFHYFLEFYPRDGIYRVYIRNEDKEKIFNIINSTIDIKILEGDVTSATLWYMVDFDKENLLIREVNLSITITSTGMTTYISKDLKYYYNEKIEMPNVEIANISI